jgi:type II secretory pathway pseudopilin PulG
MHVKTKAFSLVELMIAAALGLILMGMVMYTLSTTSRAMNQTMAQVELHNRARSILEIMTRDFEAMEAESTTFSKTDTSGDTTACTFLTHDFDEDSNYPTNNYNDYVWVKYSYDATSKILTRLAIYPTTIDYSSTPSFASPDRSDTLDIKTNSFFISNPSSSGYIKLIEAELEIEAMQGGTTRNIGIAASIPF